MNVAEQLAALTHLAGIVAWHDRERVGLTSERDKLILSVTAAGVGATTVARAAGVSTAMVYKILGRAA